MDSIRPLLPAGVRLEPVYDQGALVRDSIASVRDAMLLGGALAVLVLLLFLGEWRTTVAAALSLPLTVAITLLGLALAGDSLNLMSLGGLAVAIGIIIDDAVVVVENIERRLALHPDEPPAEVVRRGDRRDHRPGGRLDPHDGRGLRAARACSRASSGEFFRSFAIALAVAVLLSLALADDADSGHRGALGLAAAGECRGAMHAAWIPRLSLAGLEAALRPRDRLDARPPRASRWRSAVALLVARARPWRG